MVKNGQLRTSLFCHLCRFNYTDRSH
jgi:hypothetical protein